MKKRISIIISLLVSVLCSAQTGEIDINGTSYPVDTLENYPVGPGVVYKQFNIKMGTTLHKLYLLTVDLTNPYNKIEEYQGQGIMGKTELMTSAHKKIDSIAHHPVGSVNCNFWVVSSQNVGNSEGMLGQPFAGTAKDGYLIGEPDDWNAPHGDRGFVMIDENKKALIRNLLFDGKVTYKETTRNLRDCNRSRVTLKANELALFNRYAGKTRTTSDAISEVIFTTDKWEINKPMTCTILSVTPDATGGTVLEGTTGALQGKGASKLFLEGMVPGDTFTMDLGMFSTSDSIRPVIEQMVTGNCLVMADGVLTDRNTNEEYNNRNYPRTLLATNNEGDKFWMLVSEQPGNYTAEMCAIVKHEGATYAAGMDGGGSAQMNLRGTIMNKTTEASPRSVANCLFVVSTAPEDTEIGILHYYDALPAVVSSYASYTPQLRAYNQYEYLLDNDFRDYTLSCEPASLRTISADGKTFTAAAEGGRGKLIARSGNAVVEKELIVQAGTIRLRLDSLLTDRRDYKIEVLSSVEGKDLTIDPKYLSWSVDDPTICSVNEQGILNGIKNGRTQIVGQLGEISDTMQVTVEIANSEYMVWDDFSHQDLWTLSGASLDAIWNGNQCMLSLTGARKPALTMTTNRPLYGCPDSIIVEYTSGAKVVTETFNMKANNEKATTVKKSDEIDGGQSTCISFTPKDIATDASDPAIYPIWFNYMTLTLSNVFAGDQVKVTPTAIRLHYSHFDPTALERIDRQTTSACKIFKNGQIYIIKNGKQYNILGYEFK